MLCCNCEKCANCNESANRYLTHPYQMSIHSASVENTYRRAIIMQTLSTGFASKWMQKTRALIYVVHIFEVLCGCFRYETILKLKRTKKVQITSETLRWSVSDNWCQIIHSILIYKWIYCICEQTKSRRRAIICLPLVIADLRDIVLRLRAEK